MRILTIGSVEVGSPQGVVDDKLEPVVISSHRAQSLHCEEERVSDSFTDRHALGDSSPESEDRRCSQEKPSFKLKLPAPHASDF
jgi:hypothetical protein